MDDIPGRGKSVIGEGGRISRLPLSPLFIVGRCAQIRGQTLPIFQIPYQGLVVYGGECWLYSPLRTLVGNAELADGVCVNHSDGSEREGEAGGHGAQYSP